MLKYAVDNLYVYNVQTVENSSNYRAQGPGASTKTQSNETKRPRRNHRNERNDQNDRNETAETSETTEKNKNKWKS